MFNITKVYQSLNLECNVMYHYLHVYNQTCQLYDTAVFVDTLTAILPALQPL